MNRNMMLVAAAIAIAVGYSLFYLSTSAFISYVLGLGIVAALVLGLGRLGGTILTTLRSIRPTWNRIVARIAALVTPAPRRRRRGSAPSTPGPTGPSHDPIQTYPAVYFVALGALLVLYLLVGVSTLGIPIKVFGKVHNLGYIILLVGLFHYASGIRVVGRDELGGVLVLGIATIELTGFIVCVPAFIFQLGRFQLAPIEIRVPRDPAKVWRGKKNEKWPEGFEEPLRVPFAGREHKNLSKKLQKSILPDDPLLKRATEEVSFFVRLVIKQGTARDEYGFFDFFVRIGSYENARNQVKPVGIAKIFEDFTRISVAEALASLQQSNKNLETHLCNLVSRWGVDIVTAKITIGLSYSINSAIEGIPMAQATAQATVLTAEATKKRLQLEGAGRGLAFDAELDGKGKGQKKQMNHLGVKDAKVVIAAEVADSIAKSPNEKIIALGAEGLVRSVKSIAAAFGR